MVPSLRLLLQPSFSLKRGSDRPTSNNSCLYIAVMTLLLPIRPHLPGSETAAGDSAKETVHDSQSKLSRSEVPPRNSWVLPAHTIHKTTDGAVTARQRHCCRFVRVRSSRRDSQNHDLAKNDVVRQTTTDQTGRFRELDIQPGRYVGDRRKTGLQEGRTSTSRWM